MEENRVPLMNDWDIKERVESLAGKNTRILDCEKKSSLVTEEVLLLNGQPVRLVGIAGERIKAALKSGQPPPADLLSDVLIKAGIQNSPVQVETVMSMKTNTKTSEVSTLKDSRGQLVDEKMKEFEEDDEFESTNLEIWERDEEQQNRLKGRMDEETNKMWDFYKDNIKEFQGGKIPKEMIFTTETEESSRSKNISRGAKTGNFQQVPTTVSHQGINPEYENMRNSSDLKSHPGSSSYYENIQRVPSPSTSAYNFKSPSSPTVSSSSRDFKSAKTSPGKMPPLSIPSNPKLRPPVPPKPAFIQAGNLRLDKNLSLPVRVVYETFI